MAFSGDASAMGLDEVVAFLARNQLEGVLTITCRSARLTLYLHDGRLLCPCSVRVQRRLPKRKGRRRSPGSSGTIDRAALAQMLGRAAAFAHSEERKRVTENLHSLLNGTEGTFKFEPGELSPKLVADLERTGLVFDPTALVMEAARRADEERARRRSRTRRACEKRPRSGTRVARRPPRRLPRRGRARPRRLLRGDLDGIGLPALLQDLRTTRRTGTLAVTAGGCTETIHFHRGDAYLLRDRSEDAKAFVKYMVGDAGARTLSGLAGKGRQERPRPHGELQTRFLDMLFWEDAQFAFDANDLPLEFHVPSPRTLRIRLDTQRFLLQAIGLMAEWEEIRAALGGPGAVLRFRTHELKLRAVGKLGDYLTLVDGVLTFDEMVRRAGLDRLEAGRTLVGLVNKGIVLQETATASA